MPALKNQKHEAFVQGLLKGMTADAAYEAAGYAPNRFNASRLKTSENIKRRLEELQNLVTERVVKAVAVDRQWVIETLLRNARICMGDEKVKIARVKDGMVNEFEITARDAAQANAALKLLGQIPEVALFSEVQATEVNVSVTTGPTPVAPEADRIAEITKRFMPRVVANNDQPTPTKKASGD